MNKDGFRTFLKKQKRSEGTIAQRIRLSGEFEAYCHDYHNNTDINAVKPEDLHAFISWMKSQCKSVNSYLWALYRYYDYKQMHQCVSWPLTCDNVKHL